MEILVEIEKNSNGFFGHAVNAPGVIIGIGKTKEACLDDIREGLDLAIEISKELKRDTYSELENGYTVIEKVA